MGQPFVESPFKDLTQTLREGYQLGRMPYQARQQEEADSLANALNQRNIESKDLANILSQRKIDEPGIDSSDPLIFATAMANRGQMPGMGQGEMPGMGQGEMPGMGGAQQTQQGQQGPVNYQDLSRMLIESKINQARRTGQIANKAQYNDMSPEGKRVTEGVANALGISPTEFQQGLEQGKSLIQQAEERGIPPDVYQSTQPNFLPTAQNVSKLNEKMAALSALESLEKNITDGLAPYSQKIKGFSPLQIANAISGDDPDKQAKYLAGRMLSPELSAVRLNIMEAGAGKGAIDSMGEKSLSESGVFELLVTPEVYQKAQNLASKWIGDAGRSYEQRMVSTGRGKPKERVIKEYSDEELMELYRSSK